MFGAQRARGKGLHCTLNSRRVRDMSLHLDVTAERHSLMVRAETFNLMLKEYPVNSTGELRLPDFITVNIRMADYEKIRRPIKRSPTNQAPGAEHPFI